MAPNQHQIKGALQDLRKCTVPAFGGFCRTDQTCAQRFVHEHEALVEFALNQLLQQEQEICGCSRCAT